MVLVLTLVDRGSTRTCSCSSSSSSSSSSTSTGQDQERVTVAALQMLQSVVLHASLAAQQVPTPLPAALGRACRLPSHAERRWPCRSRCRSLSRSRSQRRGRMTRHTQHLVTTPGLSQAQAHARHRANTGQQQVVVVVQTSGRPPPPLHQNTLALHPPPYHYHYRCRTLYGLLAAGQDRGGVTRWTMTMKTGTAAEAAAASHHSNAGSSSSNNSS